MSYNKGYDQYSKDDEEERQLKQRLALISQRKTEYEKTTEFKDAKIKELELKVGRLEMELAPYREKAAKKDMNEYYNRPCTGKHNCTCSICRDC